MTEYRLRGTRSAVIVLTVVGVLALGACPDREPRAADTVEIDPADATQTHLEAAAVDAQLEQAVRDYRLSMPRMEQYVVAVRNLHALERTDPEVRRRMEAIAEHEDRSLSEMTRVIEGEPRVREAIESSGMSVHDYMVFSLAFMQAMMAHQFQQQGLIEAIPPEVPRENVAFVRDNEQRLQPMLQELEQMGGVAGEP